MTMTIDELLQTPYWIVDILPKQVPMESFGQYFAVKDYFLTKGQLLKIKQKHINLILKLNCYEDIRVDEESLPKLKPDQIAAEMRSRYLCILVRESLIVSEPDDTYLTVYNPDVNLLELIKTLAASEGLFVWQPESDKE